MKLLRGTVSVCLIVFMILAMTPACLAAGKAEFGSELDAAVAFAAMLERGENELALSVPASFDYTLCYRYVSMLYRDSYVFEYIPSQRNGHIQIVYGDETKHQLAEAEAAVLAARLVSDSMGQYEKYYAIYSYLRDNVEYDMKAALNQAAETGDAFSAYGALLNGMAVCDGISSAFAMICRHAGLPCIYISEPAMNHSWNAVLYNGEVRYLDATYELTGGTQVKYFMLDEASMSVDHTWDRDMVGALTDKIWDDGFISAYTLNQLGGLFRGSDKGWELDRQPSRAEAAIMLVRFLGLENQVMSADWDMEAFPFTDVNPNHAPYICGLLEMGLTKGTSPTTFTPNAGMELKDYMTFMLRALDFSEDEQFSWETAPEDALGLGVLDQEQYDKLKSSVFDRGMMAYASLAVLRADNAEGRPLYEVLSEAGAIDENRAKEILFCY